MGADPGSVARRTGAPHQVAIATGILSERDIAPPIRGILRRQRNAR